MRSIWLAISALCLTAACSGRSGDVPDAATDSGVPEDAVADDAPMDPADGGDGGAPGDAGCGEFCGPEGPVRTRWVVQGSSAGRSAARAVDIGPDGAVAAVGDFHGAVTLGGHTLRSDVARPTPSGLTTDGFLTLLEPTDGAARWALRAGSDEPGYVSLRDSLRDVRIGAGGEVYVAGSVSVWTADPPTHSRLGSLELTEDGNHLYARVEADGTPTWAHGSLVLTSITGGIPIDTIAPPFPTSDGVLTLGNVETRLLDGFSGSYSSLERRDPLTGEVLEGTPLGQAYGGALAGGSSMAWPTTASDLVGDGRLLLAGRTLFHAPMTLGNASADVDDGWVGAIGADLSSPWVRAASGLAVHDIASDAAGNLYVAGCFTSTLVVEGADPSTTIATEGETDAALLSFTRDGTLRWARGLGGRDADCARGVAIDHGRVLVAATFREDLRIDRRLFVSRGGSDILLASFSTSGVFEWAEQVGGEGDDAAYDLDGDGDGALALAGGFSGMARVGGRDLVSIGGENAFVWLSELTDPAADACDGVDCSALASACARAACDPSTGACVLTPTAEGGGCDDRDPCTDGDVCHAGACTGAPLDCSALDDGCARGVCEAGTCVAAQAFDGTACGTASAVCGARVCAAGACVDAPAADCSSCAGGVCSGGSCGAGPATLHYDFPTSALPGGWSTAGDAPWGFRPPGYGTYPFSVTIDTGYWRSGDVGDTGTSTLRWPVHVDAASTLSFSYQVNCARRVARLELWVDGVRLQDWTGAWDGLLPEWRQYSTVLAAGDHVIEWRYVKEAPFTFGFDAAFLDEVSLAPALVGVDRFESGIPPEYSVTPTGGFVIDATQAHTGGASLSASSDAVDYVASVTRTLTFAEAGNVEFWFRFSGFGKSPPNPDWGIDTVFGGWMEVFVDGTSRGIWSGVEYDVSLVEWLLIALDVGAGTHTVEWRYEQHYMGANAQVWIDDVRAVTPSTPPVADRVCGGP